MKKFYRRTRNAVIGGVCSGLSHYFNINVLYLRIICLIFVCPLIIPYLLLWIIIPSQQF